MKTTMLWAMVGTMAMGGLAACSRSQPAQPSVTAQVPNAQVPMGSIPVQGQGMPQPSGMPGMGATTPMVLGGPPASTQVMEVPQFAFTVAQAGEFQIDVTTNESGKDPEAFLFRGSEAVEKDDDGGQGTNARIVAFLAPGAYGLRVRDHNAQSVNLMVATAVLQAPTPVANLTLGAPMQVPTRAGDADREASSEVTFTIAAAGNYQIDATSSGDAKIMLIYNNSKVAEDDDGGEGTNAQIKQMLAPGMYRLRVWDVHHSATQVSVVVRPG